VGVGHPGQSGQSAMLNVGGAGSDGHAAAPIQHRSMEEPSVMAHHSKESPAPPSVQVKTDICHNFT